MLPEMLWKREEFNDSCKESESESSDSDGENTYVEESFEILFVPE